jgi:hypothetical protein
MSERKKFMNITIGKKHVSDMTDQELFDWMRTYKNNLRIETAIIWIAIMRSLDQQAPPMTVRGLFYNCENVYRVVEKSENGYRKTAYNVLNMRRAGVLPYDFIADNTRWVRKPTTYAGIESYLYHGATAYRRALWDNQITYVEIWAEKDAIAGILHKITEPWDVPLYVVKGYSSETYLYNASEHIKAQGKPAYIYYFGDYDKSGLKISKDIENKLKGFGAKFNFERVAVNKWQIQDWNLPTRPAKEKGFGDAVEIDAVPANKLRELAENVIKTHIDADEYKALLETEKLERKTLESISENFVLVRNYLCVGDE